MFFEAIWDCQINKITLLRLFRIKAQPFSLYEWSHRGKNIQNRMFENHSKKSHFDNINIVELFWAIFKDYVTQVFDDKRNSFFLCFYHIHCNKRPKRLKIHVTSKRTSKWSKKTLGLYPALHLPSFLVPRFSRIYSLIPFISLQPGLTPCTSGGGKGRKSMLLGSCIARSNSEEDLQELATKRPISPGHRGTTWNGNPIKAITSLGF